MDNIKPCIDVEVHLEYISFLLSLNSMLTTFKHTYHNKPTPALLWTHHTPASPAVLQERQPEFPGFPRVHAELQSQWLITCSRKTQRPNPRMAHWHPNRHEDGVAAKLRLRGPIVAGERGGVVRCVFGGGVSPTAWTQRHPARRLM